MNKTECEALQEYVLGLRREFHRVPEIGTRLPKTTRLVTDELDKLGIPYTQHRADGGIIAEICGRSGGKTVALRADMDALPIEEKTGLPFSSEHKGRMHACGHDAHIAMLLGAARELIAARERFSGTVRLIFQTGEEIARGAREIIDDGCMDGVDAVFGMHIGTLLGEKYPSGTLIVPNGCCMASFDRFVLRVRGYGCHGSSPEKGIDPILIASNIVLALQSIVSREIPAAMSAVLSLGKIEGGTQYNLIPDEVTLEGTTRALRPDVREKLARRLEEIASRTAEVYGGQCRCHIDLGAPPLINDEDLSALAVEAIRQAMPTVPVSDRIDVPNMGGEDFAHYLQHTRGAYLFLSTFSHEKGTDIPHHKERFDIDESVLWEGSAAFAAIAQRALGDRS